LDQAAVVPAAAALAGMLVPAAQTLLMAAMISAALVGRPSEKLMAAEYSLTSPLVEVRARGA
jgi:hypothetical protein